MSKESLITQYDSAASFLSAFKRKTHVEPALSKAVHEIISQVCADGDDALFYFNKKFDNVNRETLEVLKEEQHAMDNLSPEIIALLRDAEKNIRQFHKKEYEQISDWEITFTGGRVGQRVVPIRRVGVYVPGGTAAYPSSVLMNVIPAQTAGVPEIVLVSPPARETGMINPMVLATAQLLGIKEIVAIGGAQAVAALAFGTEAIQPVDKITGPGNQYVTEAKRQVFGHVGIDSLAGPSEIVILADQSANPVFLAADLLSQAEHDPQAKAVLIASEVDILEETARELNRQIRDLGRAELIKESLKNEGALIKVKEIQEGIELVNEIAPEHLELQLENPDDVLSSVTNAGAVFLGPYTPESVGDYWAGSNHILPTSGNARYASALSVRDFLRWISVAEYDRKKLMQESKKITQFARLEGLEAHARAVEYRFKHRNER